MDHNMDLLKSSVHGPTQKFLDTLIKDELLPTITRPSKITQTSATLIDNIFVSNNLYKNFDSALLLEDLSDHLPVMALLKQTKLSSKEPLTFETRNLSEHKLNVVKNKLYGIDWIILLDSDSCSENFDIFSAKVNKILDTVAPIKEVRISSKR